MSRAGGKEIGGRARKEKSDCQTPAKARTGAKQESELKERAGETFPRLILS